jgi:hypothetical protein
VLLGSAAILWLWVLPILLLIALNFQGYWLIEGNMNPEERSHAHLLGFAGLCNLAMGVGLCFVVRRYSLRRVDAEVTRSAGWGLPAVVVQVAYLWLAVGIQDELIPRTVTDWIYPPQRYLYNQFAFAMPSLFWGILRLACARAPAARGRSLVINLGMAVAAPTFLYLIFQLLAGTEAISAMGPAIIATLVITLGLLMFIGIVRCLALGLRNVDAWSATGERIAIVLFALAMPIAGMLLNRSIPFPNDFQAWEVYALTVANAVILLMASWQHERRPLLSLGLLCVTLPFTLYFFVVFLPFLPLSILAVMALGAGFLVLTPTVLLILHLGLFNKARRGSGHRCAVVGVLCFLLLPGFFTVRGLADKAALNAALDHVYAPVITGEPITYPANRTNLRRALSNHRSYKNGIYYPLLSDYYAWLVFDHLVLPDSKLEHLERVFFGKSGSSENNDWVARDRRDMFGARGSSVRDRNRMPRTMPAPRTVEVDRLDVNAKATDGDATIVTLTLTLRNTGGADAEYMKTLPLPAGIYASGFRLHINGMAVPGRITEKKTALWVYTMIRDSERRDPGLLFYNSPDELELRVFPVVATTPSIVEIDFLVPAKFAGMSPIAIAKDPALVMAKLGEGLKPRLAHDERGDVIACGLDGLLVSRAERERYLHLIVDRSLENGFDGDLPAAVRMLRGRFPDVRTVRVTLANYEIVDLPSESGALDSLPLRGGFVADQALAQVIRKHRDADLDNGGTSGLPPRPVVMILSRKAKTRTLELGVTRAWGDLTPALEIHEMDTEGGFVVLGDGRFEEAPLLKVGRSVRPFVRGRPVRFARSDSEARLEYWLPEESAWRPVDGVTTQASDTPWARATALQARQQDHERSPGDTSVGLKSLVKASRESGVMLASTSYIVVENSAQWRMLDVSERKKLDQNAALDFKEAPAPSALWLVVGFVLWLGVRRWSHRRFRSCRFGG